MGSDTHTAAGQFLTFRLDDEVFALDIVTVREVVDFTRLTKVPRTPDFLRGVINLRGNVVPVVDLKLKFGIGRTDKTIDTCVIIAEVMVDGETNILGALADSVEDVVDLDPSQIEPPPRIGTRIRSDYIRGMGKRDGGFILLLDFDQVFSADELSLARDAGALLRDPAAEGETR